MAKRDGLTHKQHYVPQVYLRGFSADKNSVFFLNLTSYESSKCAVPVESVCFKRDLYEAKNEHGGYVFENHIEKALGNLERRFSDYREKLERKAFDKENFKTKCFLSNEEKCFWIVYLSVQIMRSPKVLSIAKNFCIESLQGDVSICKAENIALSYCLPFFTDLSVDSINALSSFMNPMLNMSFNIGTIHGNEELFTSDNPIFIHANWPCEEYDKVIFPITSKLCMFLYGGVYKKGRNKNVLLPIDEKMLNEINWSIAYNADKMIFSANRLNKNQEKEIRRIHKLRLEDDKRILSDLSFGTE